MTTQLPDGDYPFANVRLPLRELAMMEAPRELEALLVASARASGIEIVRDQPVELTCSSEEYPDATFVVFWPSGQERMNILAPAGSGAGRA